MKTFKEMFNHFKNPMGVSIDVHSIIYCFIPCELCGHRGAFSADEVGSNGMTLQCEHLTQKEEI